MNVITTYPVTNAEELEYQFARLGITEERAKEIMLFICDQTERGQFQPIDYILEFEEQAVNVNELVYYTWLLSTLNERARFVTWPFLTAKLRRE